MEWDKDENKQKETVIGPYLTNKIKNFKPNKTHLEMGTDHFSAQIGIDKLVGSTWMMNHSKIHFITEVVLMSRQEYLYELEK